MDIFGSGVASKVINGIKKHQSDLALLNETMVKTGRGKSNVLSSKLAKNR